MKKFFQWFSLAHRVSQGAQFLDQRRPGWHRKVSLLTLDINDPTCCVVAQLYGHNYSLGADRLGLTYLSSLKYGFNGWRAVWFANPLWKQEIRKRREADFQREVEARERSYFNRAFEEVIWVDELTSV